MTAAKQLWLKGRSYQGFSAFKEQGNTINGCNCFFVVVVVCRDVFDSNKAVICLLIHYCRHTAGKTMTSGCFCLQVI